MNPPEQADRIDATYGPNPSGWDTWGVLEWCSVHKGFCFDEDDPVGCPACATEREAA